MNLARLSRLSQIVATIGVIPAVWGIFDSSEKSRIEDQKTQAMLRLTAFPALDGMVQRDRQEREHIETAVAELKRIGAGGIKSAFPTGKTAYYGIQGLADAGRHYEYLGAMIRLGYVEFEPIFEVVSFPDEVWEEMETSGLLAMIRTESWGAAGEPMPDFWMNFEYLRSCYQAARKGDPLPGQDLEPETTRERMGKWWRQRTR